MDLPFVMKKTLIDSSFLFSVINHEDAHHAACVKVVLDDTLEKLVLVTVIPETCYLLHRWLGHRVMRAFIESLQDPLWKIEPVLPSDFVRVSEILNQYADARLDLVDASLITVAERLGIETILTLDQRDFRVVRPKHVDFFEVRP
jgi:predicted nucleic acid-binding protein